MIFMIAVKNLEKKKKIENWDYFSVYSNKFVYDTLNYNSKIKSNRNGKYFNKNKTKSLKLL